MCIKNYEAHTHTQKDIHIYIYICVFLKGLDSLTEIVRVLPHAKLSPHTVVAYSDPAYSAIFALTGVLVSETLNFF